MWLLLQVTTLGWVSLPRSWSCFGFGISTRCSSCCSACASCCRSQLHSLLYTGTKTTGTSIQLPLSWRSWAAADPGELWLPPSTQSSGVSTSLLPVVCILFVSLSAGLCIWMGMCILVCDCASVRGRVCSGLKSCMDTSVILWFGGEKWSKIKSKLRKSLFKSSFMNCSPLTNQCEVIIMNYMMLL